MTKEVKAEEQILDEEIFIPEGEDDIWTAKPLTLKGTVLLVRLLGGVLAKITIRADRMFSERGEITEEGIMEIISVLNPPIFRELLCLITGSEPEIIEETYTPHKAMKVIIDFWNNEEISKLLGEAKRLAANQEFQERNAG